MFCRSEEDEKKLRKILLKDGEGPLSRQEEEEREREGRKRKADYRMSITYIASRCLFNRSVCLRFIKVSKEDDWVMFAGEFLTGRRVIGGWF